MLPWLCWTTSEGFWGLLVHLVQPPTRLPLLLLPMGGRGVLPKLQRPRTMQRRHLKPVAATTLSCLPPRHKAVKLGATHPTRTTSPVGSTITEPGAMHTGAPMGALGHPAAGASPATSRWVMGTGGTALVEMPLTPNLARVVSG
jgi:hypothetical protein